MGYNWQQYPVEVNLNDFRKNNLAQEGVQEEQSTEEIAYTPQGEEVSESYDWSQFPVEANIRTGEVAPQETHEVTTEWFPGHPITETRPGPAPETGRMLTQVPYAILTSVPRNTIEMLKGLWGAITKGARAEVELAKGEPVDKKEYEDELAARMKEIMPIEKWEEIAEEKTGLPIQAKAEQEKNLRFLSDFFGLSPMKMLEMMKGGINLMKGKKLPSSGQAAKSFIGEGGELPYEVAERMQKQFPRPMEPVPELPAPVAGQEKAASVFAGMKPEVSEGAPLKGRVTPTQHKSLGLRQEPYKPPLNAQDRVNNMFNVRSSSPKASGESIQKIARKEADDARDVIKGLYEEAEDLNSVIAEEHGQLMDELDATIAQIESVAAPSAVEQRLVAKTKSIRNMLADIKKVPGEAGEVVEQVVLKQVSNKDLIQQARSLRQEIDANFMAGDEANKFIPTIRNILNAARRAAKNQNAKEAIVALDEANSAYREWNRVYNNDLTKWIRKPTNQTPNKIFKRSSGVDEINLLRPILEKSADGRELLKALEKRRVKTAFGKKLENPAKNRADIEDALEELSGVLSHEQINQMRKDIFAPAPRPVRARKDITKEQRLTKEGRELAIEKNKIKEKPEEVLQMMDSRSGIREARDRFGAGKDFQQLMREKTRDILYKGGRKGNPTGTELFDILNQTKNQELLVEMHGKKAVDELYELAEYLGNKEATAKRWKQFGKDTGRKLVIAHFLGIV